MRANIMLPYSDRLARFAAWYVQLWGESLGKNGEGTTPVAALGPVDQHSQLQLYLDGTPQHFIHGRPRGLRFAHRPTHTADLAKIAGADYLARPHRRRSVAARQLAIPEARPVAQGAGRPCRSDRSRPGRRALGAAVMHSMLKDSLPPTFSTSTRSTSPAVDRVKSDAPLLGERRLRIAMTIRQLPPTS